MTEQKCGLFDTHKLNDKGFEAVKEYKETMSEAITKALELMPEGRYKAIFKTNIETAAFYGTKAIAEFPGNHSEVIRY